jgi:hypothetical protein
MQGWNAETGEDEKEKEWEGATAEVVGGKRANGAFCPACAITGVVSGNDCKKRMKRLQRECE